MYTVQSDTHISPADALLAPKPGTLPAVSPLLSMLSQSSCQSEPLPLPNTPRSCQSPCLQTSPSISADETQLHAEGSLHREATLSRLTVFTPSPRRRPPAAQSLWRLGPVSINSSPTHPHKLSHQLIVDLISAKYFHSKTNDHKGFSRDNLFHY